MRYIWRLSIFLVFAAMFTGSGSALSCMSSPGSAVIHCPEDNSCNADINAENSSESELSMRAEDIPETGEIVPVNETLVDREMISFKIHRETNRNLPDPEKAFSAARSLCPVEKTHHIYPKKSFQKEELQDTTNCYRTRIETLDNYYLVWRQGTTENWLCTEKVRGQMISGGETHYAAPVGVLDLTGRLLGFLGFL